MPVCDDYTEARRRLQVKACARGLRPECLNCRHTNGLFPCSVFLMPLQLSEGFLVNGSCRAWMAKEES